MIGDRALFDRLSDPVARLEYCINPLLGLADDRGYLAKRAFSSASRLLGVKPKFLRALARSAASRGGFDCWLAARKKFSSDLPFIGELPEAEFGLVYLARLSDYPFVIKIGFTNSPKARMVQLQRETGCVHEIIELREGTLFDETLNFLARAGDHIFGEWFFSPDLPIPDEMPPFLAKGYSASQWAAAARLNRIGCHLRKDTGLSALGQIYFSELMGNAQ